MSYTETNTGPFKPKLPSDQRDLAALRRQKNPNGEPVGHYTGRCAHCGSSNLWDDNLAYGCNSCGAMLAGN